MGRFAAAAVVLALLVGACGSGGAAGEEIRLVRSALQRTDAQGRTFTYTEVTGDQRVEIRGKEEDDLRYQGLVTIDGVDVFEGIISDDAFALRLVDPARAPEVVAAAMAEDEVLGTALQEGRWVVDHTAAPAVIQERREGRSTVGANPFLDVFYLFQYLPQAINDGASMERFNPEDLQYNPEDDPWSEDAERNLQDRGVRRYDLVLPGLPSRSARGTEAALPSIEHFRKMAFYLKGREVLEIREQVDITDRREFRRAAQGRAADYYVELMQAALSGFTQEPVRQRRMRYQVGEFSSDITVGVPAEAEAGTLTQTVGDEGLGALFEPLPERRDFSAGGQLPFGGEEQPSDEEGEETP